MAAPPKGPKGARQAWDLIEQYMECAKKKDSACLREKLDALDPLKKHGCPMIAEEFRSRGEELLPHLATALVELRCEEAVPLAVEFLSSRENEGRGPVAVIFAQTKEEALVEPISGMIKKGRPFDKEKGCEALGIMGKDGGIPALVLATKDKFFSVRLQAAASLANFKSDESRNALCALLENDTNSGVRLKAAASLGKSGDVYAVPCLWKGLNDKVGAVVTASHQALVAVAGLDVGLKPDAWEMWWNKNKPKKKKRRY